MSNELPNYVASATPVPEAKRIPWYMSTAQTYAGIMLWFVFWQDLPVGQGIAKEAGQYSAFAGGMLSNGIVVALLGILLAALVCHFLFYLVPGLLGLKSGLPLYIVGTSTYGVKGGFLMPGFLMGLLQFGWLGVSSYYSALLLCEPLHYGPRTVPHAVVATVWAIAAAFVGLKGIRYVGRVAAFAPIIPLTTLVVIAVGTLSGVSGFHPESAVDAGLKTPVVVGTTTLHAARALSPIGVISVLMTYIVGYFATAGAAGVDFGMNNRNAKDVHLGGLFGIVFTTVFAGGLTILVVAGGLALGKTPDGAVLRATAMLPKIVGENWAGFFLWLLALGAFPSTCFSTFIASNSFKTTLPRVNPLVSVGIGTLASILLAVTAVAGDVTNVFLIIGASFGPICGAMAADFLLAGRKWAGPRAGFNPAGWLSWAFGFVIGAADFIPGLQNKIPAPSLVAFVVGFVLYVVFAKIGLQSKSLEMPTAKE